MRERTKKAPSHPLPALFFISLEPPISGLHEGIFLAARTDNAPFGDAGDASGSAVTATTAKHPDQVQTHGRLRYLQCAERVFQAVLRPRHLLVVRATLGEMQRPEGEVVLEHFDKI